MDNRTFIQDNLFLLVEITAIFLTEIGWQRSTQSANMYGPLRPRVRPAAPRPLVRPMRVLP